MQAVQQTVSFGGRCEGVRKPRAEEPLSPAPFPTSTGRLTLDFGVEHGMLDDEDLIQGPPVSTPVPDALEAAPLTPSAPTIRAIAA